MEFYNRNWRIANSWNGTEDNNTKFSNYSMSFDGSSEFIDLGNVFDNVFTGSNFTVSTWIYASTNTTYNNFFNKGTTVQFYLHSNKIKIYLGSGPSQGIWPLESTATLSLNTWYNIIFTRSGNENKLYINGSLDNSATSTSSIPSSTGSLTLSSYNGGSNYFWEGKLDHCCIFDYGLSQAQITELYGSSSTGVGNPMAITNGRKPVAYYPLGDYSAFNGEYLVPNSAISDYALNFDGDSRIQLASATGLNFGTGDFTYSLWVNTVDNGNNYFFGNSTDASANNGTIAFGIHSANDPSWRLWVSGETIDGTLSVSDSWKHCVIRRTSGVINVFVNSIKDTSTGTLARGITNVGDIRIGTFGATEYINGEISNFAIFNTALPATGTESIESLYNYGTPPDISSYSSLQGFWKLDASATFDGSNWSIEDSSSNSNTGTSSGMTAANLVQSNLNILSPYSRYALELDSTDDYINLSSSSLASSLNGLTQFTLSLWYNQNAVSNKFLFDFKDGTNRIAFQLVNASTNFLYFNSSNNAYSASDTPTQQWNNFVLVFDGSQANADRIKVYINNSKITASSTGTIDAALGSFGASSIFNLGASHAATQTFNGAVSNLSLWNTALNPTEIYNNHLPSNLKNHSSYSNLISWWQLGENSSFNTNWIVLNEISTGPNGVSVNMSEDDLISGVGTTANGLSSGMGGADNILGEAPYSNSNALSYGMGADAKSTSVPS